MQKPNEPRADHQKEFVPPMSTDFVVTVRGQRVRWLEWVLGAVVGPIWKWRTRRAFRHER